VRCVVKVGKNANTGVDGPDGEAGSELGPDRYYLLGDAGSFFFDPAGDNDGFELPPAPREEVPDVIEGSRPHGAPRKE